MATEQINFSSVVVVVVFAVFFISSASIIKSLSSAVKEIAKESV